jgi:hypothetical protein
LIQKTAQGNFALGGFLNQFNPPPISSRTCRK